MSGKRSSLLGSFKDKLSRKNSMNDPKRSSDSPFPATTPTRRPQQPRPHPFATAHEVDAPPPYSAAASTPPTTNLSAQTANNRPTSSRSVASAISVTSTADDPYAFLNSFDTVFVIDDSGSMAGRSWRECSQALEQITPICTAHDADGIDIFFLNTPSSRHHRNVKLASTVHEIFSTVRPYGGTPTGQCLNRIIKEYLNRLANAEPVKPMNIIVITDGIPTDDVDSVLVNTAKKLDKMDADPWQLGVQFVQVGNESGAREHLEGLDDELAAMGGGCRDIVDTVPFTRGGQLSADKILKVVLGAVNKRLDRRSNA